MPEVPGDADLMSSMADMRKLMKDLSSAAKSKAARGVEAKKRMNREQMRHEEVMRQVQKTFDDHDEYVRRAEARQHAMQQKHWRQAQREKARDRKLRRMRGGSLPDINAPAPAPAPTAEEMPLPTPGRGAV